MRTETTKLTISSTPADEREPPLPADLAIELHLDAVLGELRFLVPVLHGHALGDVARARVPLASEVWPAHLARVEQRDLAHLGLAPVRRGTRETIRDQVRGASESDLQRQRHVMPAAGAPIAVHRERDAVDALVAQDLVLERVARVEFPHEGHVPLTVGPAAATLHADLGARVRRFPQHLARKHVTVAPRE